MLRVVGVRRTLVPLGLIASLAGCGDRRVPLPELPQLTQAREFGEFGGDRLRDSNACRGETTSVETLVACMGGRGWTFVRRWGAYPSDVCWEVREAKDPRRLPDPMCFERSSPPAPTAAPVRGAPPAP